MHFSHRHTSIRVALLLFCLSGVGLMPSAPANAAILQVNSRLDGPDLADDGICSTGAMVQGSGGLVPECTLRAAIEEANRDSLPSSIRFSNIPITSGFATISPATPLPSITEDVVIDGSTAPGYDTVDPFAVPIIQISGSSAPAGANGLTLNSQSSDWEGGSIRVKSIAIFNFDGDGIAVQGLSGVNAISGCQIGIWKGIFYQGNAGHGISVTGIGTAEIGKSCSLSSCNSLRGNVISASGGDGIHVEGSFSMIVGNRIGTDRSGTQTFVSFGGATPNLGWGIYISSGSSWHDIGVASDDPTASNLISGNKLGGVFAETNFLQIYGNKIGTNLAGTAALPNEGRGISLSDTFGANHSIGGTGTNEGNLVSGNLGDGIVANGGQSIVGNTIGLTFDQSAPLGNTGSGVVLDGASARVELNVIGGNGAAGILANGSNSEILANWVGTNAAGADLGNSNAGIYAFGAGTEIGRASLGNTIGFNGLDGIFMPLFAQEISVVGNWIGTNSAGLDLGNDRYGMFIIGSGMAVGGAGGRQNGEANVIAFNNDHGIDLHEFSTDNVIQGNFVGTDSSDAQMPNGWNEIDNEGTNNQIGASLGTFDANVEEAGNVIFFNGDTAIRQGDGQGNVMRGNAFFSPAVYPAIDLGPYGPTANDLGDVDTGPNNMQNYPEFDVTQTQWNESSGQLEVRYRVTSNLSDAAYPLKIDFYLRTFLDSKADLFIGSDSYPATAATLYRLVGINPVAGVGPSDSGDLVAIATDADGNSSEISTQPIFVPEPSMGLGFGAGILGLVSLSRSRSKRRGSADVRAS